MHMLIYANAARSITMHGRTKQGARGRDDGRPNTHGRLQLQLRPAPLPPAGKDDGAWRHILPVTVERLLQEDQQQEEVVHNRSANSFNVGVSAWGMPAQRMRSNDSQNPAPHMGRDSPPTHLMGNRQQPVGKPRVIAADCCRRRGPSHWPQRHPAGTPNVPTLADAPPFGADARCTRAAGGGACVLLRMEVVRDMLGSRTTAAAIAAAAPACLELLLSASDRARALRM